MACGFLAVTLARISHCGSLSCAGGTAPWH